MLAYGDELRAGYGKIAHETKAHAADLVTELDRKVEQGLAEALRAFDSTIGFRGEEFGVQSKSDTTWLSDPIDGTTHFVRGMPFCTSMLALIDEGEAVLSIIYDFIGEQVYWAIKGEGAYCGETKLKVSDRPLSNSIIGFESNQGIPANLKLRQQLRERTNFLQTLSAGFEFAAIASGKIEGRIAKDPYGKDWDFAPGTLLIKEAGGIVTNLGKKTYDYTNHDFLALNPVVYKELTEGPDAIL